MQKYAKQIQIYILWRIFPAEVEICYKNGWNRKKWKGKKGKRRIP